MTPVSGFTEVFSSSKNNPNIQMEYEVVSSTQSSIDFYEHANAGTPKWASVCDAAELSTVTVPLKTTMSNSAPSATITVNGCSPSPSTFSSDGAVHDVTMNPSCSYTESFSNSGNSRDGFIVSSAFSATSPSESSCASGTCAELDLTAYEQLQNTYQANANAQTDFDTSMSWIASGTYLGTSSSTICTISSTSATSDNCQGWADYNLAVSLPSTATGAPSNSQWLVSGTDSWTQTTGGNTNIAQYYKQWSSTFKITANAQTDFDSGLSSVTITGYSLGVSGQTICSITVTVATSDTCTGYSDNGQVATFPASISGAPTNSRWENSAGSTSNTASITSGANTYTGPFFKQWTTSYVIGALAQTNFDASMTLAVTGPYLGASGTTLCTITTTAASSDSCTGYIDNNGQPSYAKLLSGAPSNSQWENSAGSSTTGSAITSGGGSQTTVNYYKQWTSTFQVTCKGPTDCDGSLSLVIKGTSLGTASTSVCTASSSSSSATFTCTGYTDNGQVVNFSSTLSGSATNTRWGTFNTTASLGANNSAKITSSGTINENYYKQDLFVSFCNSCVVKASYLGVANTAIANNSYFDYASNFNVTGATTFIYNPTTPIYLNQVTAVPCLNCQLLASSNATAITNAPSKLTFTCTNPCTILLGLPSTNNLKPQNFVSNGVSISGWTFSNSIFSGTGGASGSSQEIDWNSQPSPPSNGGNGGRTPTQTTQSASSQYGSSLVIQSIKVNVVAGSTANVTLIADNSGSSVPAVISSITVSAPAGINITRDFPLGLSIPANGKASIEFTISTPTGLSGSYIANGTASYSQGVFSSVTGFSITISISTYSQATVMNFEEILVAMVVVIVIVVAASSAMLIKKKYDSGEWG